MGRQPAIAAYVGMTNEERLRLIRNILLQKVGSNPKTMKIYDEHVARIKHMCTRPRTLNQNSPSYLLDHLVTIGVFTELDLASLRD